MTNEQKNILCSAVRSCNERYVTTTLDFFNSIFTSCIHNGFLLKDVSYEDLYDIVFSDYIERFSEVE